MVRTKAVPAVRAVFPDGDEVWQDDPASIHRTREAIDACTAFNDRIPHENQAAKCSDIWPIEQVCRFPFLEVFIVYFKFHLKFPWTQPDAYLVCPWHLPNYLTIIWCCPDPDNSRFGLSWSWTPRRRIPRPRGSSDLPLLPAGRRWMLTRTCWNGQDRQRTSARVEHNHH